MNSIIDIQSLNKKYHNGHQALSNVSLEIQSGEIFALLGPNGAGKTTSFRMTCGMVAPDACQVRLGGHDVTDWPMFRRCRDGGMGYLAQESSVFRKLSVQNNLRGVMEMLNIKRRDRYRRCEELMEQFGITKLRRNRAISLSGGERRRLELARSLVSDPKIILLDEPFTGIDPVTIDNIQAIIRDLREQGISILITDHQVRETLEITDRSYVMRNGQVLCQGQPREVLENPEARRYYFGEDMDLGLGAA